jgi:hypothetical protein
VKGSLTPDPAITTLAGASTSADQSLLTGLTLTAGANQWTMHWTPAADHPYGMSHTLTLYAVDSTGRISNQVTITLTVTNNPPTWIATPTTTVTCGVSTPTTIWVKGTDINPDDGGKLGINIYTLPTKGTLQIEKPDGTRETVSTSATYNYTAYAWPRTDGITNSGGTTDQTWFKFIYTPYASTSGCGTGGFTDSFTGNFIDRSGATGSGTATINYQVPPDTQNWSVSNVMRTQTYTFSIPAWSTQNQLTGIYITQVFEAYPSLATLTVTTPTGSVTLTSGTYTSPLFIPFTGSPSGLYSFTYTYTTTQYDVINDWFKYYAVDSRGLTSPIYTATITGAATPVAGFMTRTVAQGSTTYYPFVYGTLGSNPATNVNLYHDADTIQSGLAVRITRVPTVSTDGVFYNSATGTPLTVGMVLNYADLFPAYSGAAVDQTNGFYYVAPQFSAPTNAYFEFEVYETARTTAVSNIGRVTMTVAATQTPPIITLTPQVIIDRETTAPFTLTVKDNDSDFIYVYIVADGTFPYKCASWTSPGTENIQCSTLTLPTAPTSTVSTAPVDGDTNSMTQYLLLTIDNTGKWGTTYTYNLPFAPNHQYYSDSKTGTFSVYAKDNQNLQSATLTGLAGVNPNNKPIINFPPTKTDYTWVFNEDNSATSTSSAFSVTFPLRAQDSLKTWEEQYQDDYLRFELLSLPTCSSTPCPTLVSDGGLTIPSTISGAYWTGGYSTGGTTTSLTTTGVRTEADGTGTEMPVKVNIPADWYGTVTFQFQVRDSLGAVSDPMTVTITVNPVNDPPANPPPQVIVVYEKRCVLPLTATTAGCGDYSAPVYSTFRPSGYTSTDIDSATLSFVLSRSLNTASEGVLTLGTTPTSPATGTSFSTSTKNWLFDYQPPLGIEFYNTDCTNDADWTTCAAPKIRLTYQISDGTTTTSSANFDIYVLYINERPTTRDYTYSYDTSINVGAPIALPIQGWDVDGNLVTMRITEIHISDPATTQFISPTGTPLTACGGALPACTWTDTLAADAFTNTWNFQYQSTSVMTQQLDYIKYQMYDSYGNPVGISDVGTTTVRLNFVPTDPPQVFPEWVQMNERSSTDPSNAGYTTSDILFQYGTQSCTTPATYADYAWNSDCNNLYTTQAATSYSGVPQNFMAVTVVTLPTHGTLTYVDGLLGTTPVTVGSTFTVPITISPETSTFVAPTLRYTPSLYYNGPDSFDIQAFDTKYQQSSTAGSTNTQATVNLYVNPVNQLPVLTITSPPTAIDRTETGTFTVSATDLDSATITFYVALPSEGGVEGEFVNFDYSTLNIPVSSDTYGPTSGTIYTDPLTGTRVMVVTLNNPDPGTPVSFTMDWTPNEFYPYDAENFGSITMIAVDSDGDSSNFATGTATVTPNIPPTTTGTYTYDLDQASTSLDMTLTGTDQDPWHDTTLEVTLSSPITLTSSVSTTPSLTTVWLTDAAGNVITTMSDLTLTVDNTGLTSGTGAPVTLHVADNWYGTITYSYTVTDLAGATSYENTVTVTVWPDPVVPTTTITVQEGSCLYPPCTDPNDPVFIPCTSPNPSSITIDSPPIPPGGSFYVSTNPADAPAGADYTATDADASCGYYVWYVPDPTTTATCDNYVEGATKVCDPIVTVPVTVCDTVRNTCTDSTITVVVTPQYFPPTTGPVTIDNRAELTNVATNPMPIPATVYDATAGRDDITSITFTAFNLQQPALTNIYWLDADGVTKHYLVQGAVTVVPTDPATWITVDLVDAPSLTFPLYYENLETGPTYLSITDTFTYFVTATNGLSSNTGVGIVTLEPVYADPIAENGLYTTVEDTSVSIPIVYVAPSPTDDVPGFYNTDTRGSQTTSGVTVTVTSLPTLGTLTYNDQPVLINTAYPAGTLVYTPADTTATLTDATDSFTYTVYDPVTGGTSNEATVDIVIEHIPIAPTLNIVEPSLTVDRGSTGTFTVQVSDPDSATIDVILPNPSLLPIGDGTTPWSTWEVIDSNGIPVNTYTITNLPDGTAIITIDNTVPGTTYTFTTTFSPDVLYPEGQTGTLLLVAVDPEGKTSLPDSATVSVPVNNPPYTEDEVVTLYTLPTTGVIEKGSITEAAPLQIKLKGGDPDAADTNILDFVLTSIPDLTKAWICPTADCTAATALDPTVVATSGFLFSAEPYADTTFTSLNLWVVPADTFYGQLNLDFYVVDPLGLESLPRTLTINIVNTNEAPTSSSTVIIMDEGDCVFRDCFDPVIPLGDFIPGTTGMTTIQGSDPNDGQTDTLVLNFDSTGSCGWPTPEEGRFGYVDPVTGDMVELTQTVADTQTFAASVNWNFWFEPAPGYTSVCTGYVAADCTPDVCVNFYLTDIEGAVSPPYQIDVIVVPYNEPPVSRDYEFRIPMSTDVPSVLEVTWDGIIDSAIKQLMAEDPDTAEALIKAQSMGIVPGSVGTWYDLDGNAIPNNQITQLPGRYLKYIPPPYVFSSPSTSALATLVFKVYDPEPNFSVQQYTVKVYVDHVPQPVDWRGPREIRTLEETPVLINLNLPQYYYTPDTTGTAVFTFLEGPINGKGYFYICDDDGSNCNPIPEGPFTIPKGGFWYMPPATPEPNYGEHFTSFNFKLEILTPEGLTDPVSTFNLRFWINVDPVNDPPTLIPLSPHNITIGASAIFDENTTTFPDSIRFIRIRFGGFDTDNALTELRAQIFTLVDRLQAAVFVCDTTHLEGGTGKEDCSDGHRLTTIEFFAPIEPENAIWEISVIGYPHWNGPLRIEFVVWDSSLSSPPAMFPVTIRPINDYPSLVAGSASVRVEYYKNAGGSDSEDPENTDSGTPVPATTGRRYIRIAADRAETASYQIDDPRQVAERRLEGTTLEKNVGTQAFEPPKPDDGSDVVTIYRLRLRVQDIDFFFQRSLNVTTSYIGAGINLDVNSATTEAPADAPVAKRAAASVCVLEPYHLNCIADILTLNAEISTVGFPLQLEKGADSAVVLILIDDAGSVDWQDRPLAAGFSVTIFTPEEPLGTPIAAVVILPVIAAATAAAIAAAWIALGQRAQDYAGKSFDAFAVVASTNGHQSPLYDDQGRAVVNPLFNQGAGAPGGVGQAFVPGQ